MLRDYSNKTDIKSGVVVAKFYQPAKTEQIIPGGGRYLIDIARPDSSGRVIYRRFEVDYELWQKLSEGTPWGFQ